MNARERGFTLLELMVSLALVATMTLLLSGSLRQGSRSWEAGDLAAEREAGMLLLWRQLSERFDDARDAGFGRTGSRPLFTGDSQGVEFVTSMSRKTGGGLYIVRLEQAGHDDRRRLLLKRWLLHPELLDGEADVPRWRPYPEATEAPAATDGRSGFWYAESVLADHLREVRFTYHDGNRGTGWHPAWKGKARLPALVRLEVKDDKGSWPVMIFELPPS